MTKQIQWSFYKCSVLYEAMNLAANLKTAGARTWDLIPKHNLWTTGDYYITTSNLPEVTRTHHVQYAFIVITY